LVRDLGPDEFRDWLTGVMQPEPEKVADEMAFMLRAGGEIG
jgi:hypothetical protein